MGKARLTTRVRKPEAARHAVTIGEVERLAGIGPAHEDRETFWLQFAHLKDGAFEAAITELYRRIHERHEQTV